MVPVALGPGTSGPYQGPPRPVPRHGGRGLTRYAAWPLRGLSRARGAAKWMRGKAAPLCVRLLRRRAAPGPGRPSPGAPQPPSSLALCRTLRASAGPARGSRHAAPVAARRPRLSAIIARRSGSGKPALRARFAAPGLASASAVRLAGAAFWVPPGARPLFRRVPALPLLRFAGSRRGVGLSCGPVASLRPGSSARAGGAASAGFARSGRLFPLARPRCIKGQGHIGGPAPRPASLWVPSPFGRVPCVVRYTQDGVVAPWSATRCCARNRTGVLFCPPARLARCRQN